MSKSKRLNRDHAKKTQRPMVEDQTIAEHLTALLTPVITSQSRFCRQLTLRARVLTLPVMVAAVLTLIWRNVPGVTELGRLLETEGFLWCERTFIESTSTISKILEFPGCSLRENLHRTLTHLTAKMVNPFLSTLKVKVCNSPCLSLTGFG